MPKKAVTETIGSLWSFVHSDLKKQYEAKSTALNKVAREELAQKKKLLKKKTDAEAKRKRGAGEGDAGAPQESWIQCENTECRKWRVIPSALVGVVNLQQRWDCSMNTWDPPPPVGQGACDVPEELYDEAEAAAEESAHEAASADKQVAGAAAGGAERAAAVASPAKKQRTEAGAADVATSDVATSDVAATTAASEAPVAAVAAASTTAAAAAKSPATAAAAAAAAAVAAKSPATAAAADGQAEALKRARKEGLRVELQQARRHAPRKVLTGASPREHAV
jgi:hypothetical protein